MYGESKIAITGAAGAGGQALRALLSERRVPAERVKLLERPSDEAIISEYAGQATIIETLQPDALFDRDLVFLCGSEEETERCLLWERKRNSLFVDLSGATAFQPGVPVVNVAVNGSELDGKPRTVGAPHAISFALTSTLASLDRTYGIVTSAATILRPVSDFGDVGIEELHRQTVSLLNFTEIPRTIFGAQIGFNLLPQVALEHPKDGTNFEARLGREIDRVFGWTAPRMTLRVLVVPVFHGHSALVHVRLKEAAGLAAVRKTLSESKGVTVGSSLRAGISPVEVAGQRDKLVADIAADGLGEAGFWVWIVGADVAAHAAKNALEIAGRILGG